MVVGRGGWGLVGVGRGRGGWGVGRDRGGWGVGRGRVYLLPCAPSECVHRQIVHNLWFMIR